MTRADYVIGVDGGGTHARARLCDGHGAVLGEGQGGPGNIRLGQAVAWANVNAAIDEALGAAGLSRDVLRRTSIALGLAGIVEEDDGPAMLAAGPDFLRAVAVSDGEIACLGAWGGGDGAILITGTGSAAYAIVNGIGRPMFGWGFQVDDKGSAAALGRAAIKWALEARDGLIDDTDFTRAVRDRIGGRPSAMVGWITAARPRDFGGLAPMVIEAARAEDAAACAIIARAAHDIARMIDRLVEVGAVRVCLMGGMAAHIGPWLPASVRSRLEAPQGDALAGAILLSRRLAAPNVQDADGEYHVARG
ncbi:glucosamine kinase [Sphingomonas gellani]|uniref:Glucosamine kinase n=1 Tax=Sphingomonas gellani TaxID=1166340 RepID=A0A1H8AZ90_9SPHN|nr:BadF/BadG/BcrA/BcrD ATPase family protein [Sphingomonas gellani]SEM75214.1 glucosamine kinase [Sphingomonas gellani]